MSRKCIYRSSRPAERVEVKVYRDSESEEWVARLYLDDQLYEPADYFTNDKEDAQRTADHMCASNADARKELL